MTAFFYYHSALLMLRGEHKLCSLNRGGRTGSERGGRKAGETENSESRGVDLGQSRSLLPESQAAQMRLSGSLLPPGGQAALFVHPFHTKPSCLFTNHTVIF